MALSRIPVIASALAASLLLSACGSSAGFPSLARRPGELAAATPPTAPQPVVIPTVTSPEMQAQLARLVEQARSAHAGFNAGKAKADRLAAGARGAAPSSESWIVASVALAELESRRSEAMIALAELDSLYAADRVAGNDSPAISAARDAVAGWIAEQDRVLAELMGSLRS